LSLQILCSLSVVGILTAICDSAFVLQYVSSAYTGTGANRV